MEFVIWVETRVLGDSRTPSGRKLGGIGEWDRRVEAKSRRHFDPAGVTLIRRLRQ